MYHLAYQGHAVGQERDCPSAAEREQVRATPWPLLLCVQPWGSLLPMEMPQWSCLCRTTLRHRSGRRARGAEASLTGMSTLCSAQRCGLCQCHSSHRRQVESPYKYVCTWRFLPSWIDSDAWKSIPEGMYSSPKLQHRKKCIPLSS